MSRPRRCLLEVHPHVHVDETIPLHATFRAEQKRLVQAMMILSQDVVVVGDGDDDEEDQYQRPRLRRPVVDAMIPPIP